MLKELLHKPGLPGLLLRIGLAIVFMYAAISAFITPKEWIGYLPSVLTNHLPAETVLHIFSTCELLLAAWLLSGIYTKYAALVCAAMLAGITFTNFDLFAISFRDIGLMFAALALAALPHND
jgi:uncharacterized membrane protein YphA (DoxX/SURF4 family)